MEDRRGAELVTVDEAAAEVVKMARRLALLYHYTAEVLVEKQGEDLARETLREIIWRYGWESGETTRKKVEELGLDITADNFKAGSDLPRFGWQADSHVCADGISRGRVIYCPLAETWQEKGSTALGRIYCVVDEAKYESYNGSSCRHMKNLLDGDCCCIFDITESEGQK